MLSQLQGVWAGGIENEIKKELDFYREISSVDELTGLLNRRALDSELNRELERSFRYGSIFSVAIIDIDHFKSINDTYGHIVGDKVLASLAKILRSRSRKVDIVARYGGEEFCIVYPDTSAEQAFEAVEKAITERTACIMPVHIFGLMAEMGSIRDIARKHAVPVVEDAAQAIGAWREIDGKKVYAGTVGETGCLSFFPSKNLGGAGDGGMVVTNDPDRSEQLRRLRVHGSYPKYYHHTVGINGRLDALQAAVLRVKLKFLDQWTQKRREHAALYRELFEAYGLGNYGVSFPDAPKNAGHVYNQFTGRFPRRDALLDYLKGKGIGAAIYYPLPLHLQPCFGYLGYKKGELPHAEKAAKEVLSLPVFPELTEAEQETVIREIKEFYEGNI